MPSLSAPDFWTRRGLRSHLLLPLAWANEAASALRWRFVRPWRAPVPVICIGNLVAGGAGKTPVAESLARRLLSLGGKPHFLSRGYGGALAGPVLVDPDRHAARDVGDEPLLLAATAPAWVARDRPAGARAAAAAGAGIIVMDDGFQNPSLAKDLSFLVFDGAYGIGNGRVMPAGPLRERLASALARADAVVLIGEDETGLLPRLGRVPALRARLAPAAKIDLAGQPVIGFAGIGRPAKFFRTLEEQGAHVVARRSFPDHHRFAETELAALADEAAKTGARLMTTSKDAMRLSPSWRARVGILPVEIVWEDDAALSALLAPLAAGTGRRG